MRRFLRELSFFLAAQACILAIVLYSGRTPSIEYMSAALDKRCLFLNTPPPRIVFLGGSSAAFSLDCPRLQKESAWHAINMGLHAHLGLEYILNDFPVTHLAPGDLVILNLEYEQFTLSETEVTPDVLLAALSTRPESLAALDRPLLKLVFDEGLALPTMQSRGLVASIFQGKAERAAQQNSIYRREAFDSLGDAVAHWNRPIPVEERRQHISGHRPLKVSAPRLEDVIHKLNEFARECRTRGADLALFYPAYPAPLFETNQAAINEIDAALRRRLNFPILNRPQDAVAPIDYFFDTQYHLTKQGAEWRTSWLIDRLKKHLALADFQRRDKNRERGVK